MDESVEYILELLCSCSCNRPNWYLNEILRSGALISIITIIFYIRKKIWMSISLFIKKILHVYFFFYLKKKWMSWILGIFIILLYKWLLCFFSFFVCRTYCININTRHVHTNTYWSWWLKIALCSLDRRYWWWYIGFC